jgi:uncharacterized membrane protein YeiH
MSNLITEYQKENFKFLSGESVASVQSGQIKPDEQGRFIKSAINWFKDWLEKNKHSTEFENDQLGMVIIAPAGIKSAMSHKPRPIDVQALPVLPHVIKKARVISITKDDTGKPIENIILAAPIVVDGQRCYIVIRLRKYYEIKGEAPRYYTQAVAIETNTATSNQTEHLGDKSLTRFGESGGRDRLLNVLHDALNVNIEQKSKKIKVYGWKAIEMARNLTFEQLEILTLKTQKEHFIPKEQRTNIYLYDQKGRKKLDVLSWAVHHKLDILGVFISSFLTALGGGMIRDALADRTPYVFTTNLPVILVVGTVLVALLFKLHKIDDLESKSVFIISDAIGLVSFSITGSIIAIQNDFNFLGALILSFLTAVGGGTLRDILINRVPSILVSEFYATVALIVATIVFTLQMYDLISLLTLTLVFAFGVALRLLAYYRNWHLPTLSK